MVAAGLTVLLANILVRPASLYQVNVPVAQVAVRLVDEPAHRGLVPALAPVGAEGIGVTVTVTGAAALLHVPLTQAA